MNLHGSVRRPFPKSWICRGRVPKQCKFTGCAEQALIGKVRCQQHSNKQRKPKR